MIFCSASRTLAEAARMSRRIEASSGLAASASSSSPAMEPVILSSRKRFVMRELKRPSIQVFSLPLPSPAA